MFVPGQTKPSGGAAAAHRSQIRMAEVTADELASLQREFDCVLDEEVGTVLGQLKAAIKECANKFPVPVGEHNADRPHLSDKFVLTNTDQLLRWSAAEW